MNRRGAKKLLLCLLAAIAVIAAWFVLSMETMLFLPKGELLSTTRSPDGERVICAYLCNGGATVDWAVRCEVRGRGVLRRNLYWQYHQTDASVSWQDNDTVCINGVSLDVRWESYDYRRAARSQGP